MTADGEPQESHLDGAAIIDHPVRTEITAGLTMDTKQRRVRLRVTGIVQGVFFRGETRRQATKLGLDGYVRNMPDGTVEVVAEGNDHRVEELIAWCRKGPPHARVDDVAVVEEEPSGGESGFRIAW